MEFMGQTLNDESVYNEAGLSLCSTVSSGFLI
jgi:hypothetical protein